PGRGSRVAPVAVAQKQRAGDEAGALELAWERSVSGDALALRAAARTLAGATLGGDRVLRAFLDAVFAREEGVAKAHVRPDLFTDVAVGAVAEVEVVVCRVGILLGGTAATRAVDGVLSVAVAGALALRADLGHDRDAGAGHVAVCAVALGVPEAAHARHALVVLALVV